ncbi:MAG TPA: molybdopterin-dependent oxidoreductase, partial [Paludibacter sp.]|nr:molybdopterin-dependent oxidoreductase [Paludibacter sp.]
MKDYDLKLHVQGLSQFVDDLNLPEDTLYASVFVAPASHGRITKLDTSAAKVSKDVVAVFSYEDIPGKNQIGHIIADEPLLADTTFDYVGQPIAIVVGKTMKIARQATKLIQLEYETLPAVYDPKLAFNNGDVIGQERIFSCGDFDKAWSDCEYIFSNSVTSGAQEHLYLETQSAIAIPTESDRIKIISSTQSPSAVQKTVADVLGVSLNHIETEVIRLGGGFGGKEDQANAWAAMAGLAAFKLNKPVKLVLPRQQDITITGKRHPYSSDFRIGLSEDFKIIAYEVTFYQNAGAYADLSTAILERTLFHCTNSYYIPNVRAKGISCRTNLTPNTAFRGFGGPQAMFVIESAIYEASQHLKISPIEIQKRNLISKGDNFPFGMSAQSGNAKICMNRALEKFSIDIKNQAIIEFNQTHQNLKKGLAVMPVCFGISFTSTFLNQASALVHIYNDGSLSISTGAVEMGQGVNEKIRKTAAHIFSICEDRIRIETTNTTRIANISPTAASTGADLNGNATRIACEEILNRLKIVIPLIIGTSVNDKYEIRNEIIYHNEQKTTLNWNELILKTYRERVCLSSQAFYATPGISFDRTTEKGNPFAYHVNGTAVIQVTLDCLRGIFDIDSVEVVHDTGSSAATLIDLGQVEGGILQGLGWMTMEEIQHSDQGKLMTNSLSSYKVPDIFSIPKKMQIQFLESENEQVG